MSFYQAQMTGYGNDSRAHYAMSNLPPEKSHSTDQVHVQMPASGYSAPLVSQEHPRWSWCNMGWAMFAYICCLPWICSFFGLMCAMMSYSDHKGGDYVRSAYKRRCSWGCSITAIVLGVLFIVGIVVLAVVFPAVALAYWQQALRQSQQG